ncbi:MAG: SNF2-related protein, partial [Campylobacterota bacterium]|nr:SNF2-related protein [Campylobacterota bacterium]
RLFGANRLNDLLFYKSKYLKNGTLSQGTKLDSYKAVDDYYYRDIKDDNDYAILTMLHKEYKDQYYSYSSSSVKFNNSNVWYDALKQIIATKRAYYDTHKEPLVWQDKVFEPKMEFKKYKGLYSLRSNVHSKEHELIPTQPALLLDKANNTIQEFGMDTTLYNKLLALPKIELEDISKVYGSIAKVAPKVQTPKEIAKKHIDTPPKIHLTLLYEKLNMLKEYHHIKVHFSYEGYELEYYPQHPIHSRFEDNTQIEITRHLQSENEAKETLASFGFELEQQGEQLHAKTLNHTQKSLEIWRDFLATHIPTLQAKGWIVEFDESFGMKFESNAQVVVESQESNDWFSLGFNLEFNGNSEPIAPLIGSIINEFDDLTKLPKHITIDVDNHHYVQVPSEQIAPIIQTILELYSKEGKEGNFELNPFDAHLIENLDESVVWKGSKEILELSRKLKDFKGIEHQAPPKALNATLRDYQQEGLNWLGFLHAFNFGGILADDMGLGKTIQTLAHLSRLKEDGELNNPSLIVVPTSLIANWKNESAKFTPNLSVLSLHGMGRMERFAHIEGHDIILSTYALIPRDEERLKEHTFEYIILDEAQKIKNPKAKMTLAIKALKSNYR